MFAQGGAYHDHASVTVTTPPQTLIRWQFLTPSRKISTSLAG